MYDEPLNDIPSPEEVNSDRRRHPRSIFAYPVEFKIFFQKVDTAPFNGYLKDISISGACLQCEDKYGRIKMDEAKDVKLKLTISIPREEKFFIFAFIRWIRKDKQTFQAEMGIEFSELDYRNLAIIERLIGMKNKDHNMMWNLWEQYNL